MEPIPQPESSRRRKHPPLGPRLLGGALVLLAAAFSVGPFVWQILTSLEPEGDLSTAGLPRAITLASYEGAFRGRPFARVVLNSFIVASATTLVSLALAAPAAFALTKLPIRGKRAVLAGALAVSMFPPIATVSPLYLLLGELGWLDHLVALVVPYTTFTLPLALWILSGFFGDIPSELYLAARVDGCSPLQAFRRVLLPLAAPGLSTTAILVFVFSWNEFLYALTFISTAERRTIPVAISLFAAEHKEPWGEIAAASVVATLPLLVLTLLFQRKIVRGLTAGSVKG